MTPRRWFSETLGLAVGFAIGGTIAIGFGLPLAWTIDRMRYDWVEDDGYDEPVPEGVEPAEPEDYRLPSYEIRPGSSEHAAR